MRADWKPEKEPNMDEEIELIKKWVKERETSSMNRTRPKQIVIRVSEEELAQIKEKVEQSGKSQQQYIIHCADSQPTDLNSASTCSTVNRFSSVYSIAMDPHDNREAPHVFA